MRRVVIATPSYDGKLHTSYVNSLVNTMDLCQSQGIHVSLFTINNDPLVQVARNQLLYNILPRNPESVVWIDSDISWYPQDFISLVNSELDVIGATYRKKNDKEDYVLKAGIPLASGDVVEVDGLGFGFLKTSINALKQLWESSEPYQDGGVVYKNAFEVLVKDGMIWSEDIAACEKLQKLGYKIFLDKRINCAHTGVKHYEGNFSEWSKDI